MTPFGEIYGTNSLRDIGSLEPYSLERPELYGSKTPSSTIAFNILPADVWLIENMFCAWVLVIESCSLR